MSDIKLFMLLLGCKPTGRNTEQHDIFFGIGYSLSDLLTDMQEFWPGSGKLHIDAWREVTLVDGFAIQVVPKTNNPAGDAAKLFFINLGGYKEQEFEEYHYKILAIGKQKSDAIQQAKQTAFYKHTGFAGADSHIDDKYGIDVDDLYEIEDILPAHLKKQYSLQLGPAEVATPDQWHLGYTKLSSLEKNRL
jgi:hypothetical protein